MADRVIVKRKQGMIIPCNGCIRKLRCPIYNDVKKKRHSTNILTYCDIWLPRKRNR